MSTNEQLTCREFITFLASYLDGTAPAPARQVFAAHLLRCPDCVVYFDSYQKTITLTRQAFADDVAPLHEAPAELIDAILKARRARQ